MKLKYDNTLSYLAFNFNLRRYNLGGDSAGAWAAHDATEILKARGAQNPFPQFADILIDQGLDDQFLAEQLKPEVGRCRLAL